MSDSKTYLNVPYAQKDAAKALGARWDPVNKKWYVPRGINIELFDRWLMDAQPQAANVLQANQALQSSDSNDKASTGVFTHPTIENFLAYSGDAPPWE